MKWNALCVTVRQFNQEERVRKELELLAKLGIFEADEILVVEDACENVGSAGSALNALLATTELLCSKRGYSVLNESVLDESRILIILTGEPNSQDDCGSTFMPVSPVKEWDTIPDTVIARTIRNINNISEGKDKGLWISGTDSVFNLNFISNLPFSPISALCFCFSGSSDLSKSHGTYKVNDKNSITELSYCERDPNPFIILGLVYLPPILAISFLSLHSVYPLSCTTFYGVDTGARGLKLSLFFDLIQATCLAGEEYEANTVGNPKIDEHPEMRRVSRREIWKRFQKFQAISVPLEVSDYRYLPIEPLTSSFYRSEWLAKLHEDLQTATNNHPMPIKEIVKTILALEGNNCRTVLNSLFQCCTSPSLTARCLSLVSDVLALTADGNGGLRSGPAANPEFREAFRLLENGQIPEALESIYSVFTHNWMSSPSKLIRAAKHFEAAAQILTRREIKNLCQRHMVSLKTNNSTSKMETVTVKAAARVDLFGGWLDTPPITTMTSPSAVINMAVLIDDEYPLKCTIKKTDQPEIHLIIDYRTVIFESADQIWKNHSQPTAEGSLICACLVALEVIGSSEDDLNYRLTSVFGTAGLEINCQSSLPQGSGLGTSSILACCILKALLKMAGLEKVTNDEIVHLVLCVEQLLTTGGGWQDQVGGIYPGIKKGFISDEPGKFVDVKEININNSFKQIIEERLCLVYTGKTRLAKNLLQEVVRNWYSGGEVVKTIGNMQNVIEDCVKLLEQGIFPSEMTELYYKCKKELATGCEPIFVNMLIEKLRNDGLIETVWLAGAGGGGFLYLYLTEKTKRQQLLPYLLRGMTIHTIKVSEDPFITEFKSS